MTDKDVLRPVDDDARRLAKAMVREARTGALATLDPRDGMPLASRVTLATAIDGAPVFLISALSDHFGALEADPRASLLVGRAGRGDPLAHPRITLVGRARRLARADDAPVRRRFLARHPKAALYADFGDFAFWRLEIERASLNGGFGRAYAPTPADLSTAEAAGLAEAEAGAVAHMNEDHADAIALYATRLLGLAEGPWRLSAMDAEGLDLAHGDETARLWLDPPLASAAEMRSRLVALVREAQAKET